MNKNSTPDHECDKNWLGSSKVMELDVAGEIVQDRESNGLHVVMLVMDDDATTILCIKQTLQRDIKTSDMNQVKKHLGNSLWTLAKQHKVLTSPVISWL